MKHPKYIWSVILCGAVLAAGCDRAERNDNDTLGEKVDRAGDKIAHEAAEVGDAADRGLDATGRKIDAGIASAEQSVERAADRAAEQGEEWGDKLSDSSLTVKTKSALIADPDLSALKIDVDTKNGVVTLRGEVASSAAADKASMVVKGIDGVVSVDNQLRIGPAG